MTETLTADWIGAKLREHRIQQKELAQALDIASSGVTRLLRGQRKLRAYEVPVVLSFFARYMREVPHYYDPVAPAEHSPVSARRASATPAEAKEQVPIYAGLEQRAAGDEPVEWRESPASLRTARDVFGFFVDTDRLAPLLLAGDVAYVYPGRPARNGSRVIVKSRDGSLGAGLLVRDESGRTLQGAGETRRLDVADLLQVIAVIEAS